MRYIIKGGAWKNTEDEILKAAVMKYGLNQWSRISSLLVRKSAKQCKARWYEWLDPSIKKTEWTREEEEKLLHLAKIFPSQWRTISPIVGRTPAQCVEHYERLLDQAQGKMEPDENDPRRLKPGEIDPCPEIKPPKPDPVDMDEDEKEMLAEARVRLANTKGKKAKRKAREKQIEEARRLANLQKQRELKAAGIEYVVIRRRRRRKVVRSMDYNAEIPFERKALEYVFETGNEESPKPNFRLGNISLQALEGHRRDEEEERMRKADTRKMKKLKERDLTNAVEKINKVNAEYWKIKTKLTLPEPQLQDHELEFIGKMNTSAINSAGDENAATRALIGSMSHRDATTPTPMRTPRYEDSLMRSAQENYRLLNTETPLLGAQGEAVLENNLSSSTKNPASYSTNTKSPITPNPLRMMYGMNSTNSGRNGNDRLGANFFSESPLSQRGNTPNRTEMRIGTEERDWEKSNISDQGSILNLDDQKQNIKKGLLNLPNPQNEYTIEMPNISQVDEEIIEKTLDAEDDLRIKQENKRKDALKKERLKSLSLQKNLPRPSVIIDQIYDHLHEQCSESRKNIEIEINHEIVKRLALDSINFPIPGSKPYPKSFNDEYFSEEDILKARRLLFEEMENIKKGTDFDFDEYLDLHTEISSSFIFDPFSKKIIQDSEASDKEIFISKKWTFQRLLNHWKKQEKYIQGLEKKINIMMSGYERKTREYDGNIEQELSRLVNNEKDHIVYSALRQKELSSFNAREIEAKEYLSLIHQKENALQDRFVYLNDLLKEEKEDVGIMEECN